MCDDILFAELYKKYYSKEKNLEQYDPYIYHYTNTNGLMGIVSDKAKDYGKLHFWFTRSDFLNDTSEGKYIVDLFYKICQESKSQTTDVSFSEYIDKLLDIDFDDVELIEYPAYPENNEISFTMIDVAPCHRYICCFSKSADSLDMWRYYSKDKNGYCLKLVSNLFNDYENLYLQDFNPHSSFYKIKKFRVEYDYDKQRNFIINILKDAYNVYNKCQSDTIDIIKKFIINVIKEKQYIFKHPCFASENEYRYVLYVPKEKPKNMQIELPEIRYRNQNGVLTPYIDLEISSILYQVQLSPYITNKNADKTVKDYLKKCGSECDVVFSKLPVR